MTDTLTPHDDVTTDDDATGALAERLFGSAIAALDMQALFLGDRLGWYDAVAAGPVTAGELAERTGTDARYAREWLEHQTVSGLLAVDDPAAEPDERRFSMPAAHRPVLADPDSLSYLVPFARIIGGLGMQLDDLTEAYRTGAGVSWAHHGVHAREGQAGANRPMFLHQLGPDYLAAVPEVEAALRGGGRVADIGCGLGWSSIGIALAFPEATVDGFDVDLPSVEAARSNAAEYGVADRVQFHHVDAGSPLDVDRRGAYDVVLALECIHDLSDPVSVLATMRDLAAPEGTVIVMDERVGERFTGEPDPVERLMYGFSLVCCLPDGRAHSPSAGTGTVMRPPTLERYARDAGFGGLTVLPLENDFFRFYRLDPAV